MSISVRKNAIVESEKALDDERNHGHYTGAMENAITAYEAMLWQEMGSAPASEDILAYIDDDHPVVTATFWMGMWMAHGRQIFPAKIGAGSSVTLRAGEGAMISSVLIPKHALLAG